MPSSPKKTDESPDTRDVAPSVEQEIADFHIEGKLAEAELNKIKELYVEYKNSFDDKKNRYSLSINQLADKHGIARSTLSWYFRALDSHRAGASASSAEMLKVVTSDQKKLELAKLREVEHEKAEMAWALGSTMVRIFSNELYAMMEELHDPEAVAHEIMSWYVGKGATQKRISTLELEKSRLEIVVENLQARVEPNFRFELKADRLRQFSTDLIRLKLLGLKIDPKVMLRVYRAELDMIDQMTPEDVLGTLGVAPAQTAVLEKAQEVQ